MLDGAPLSAMAVGKSLSRLMQRAGDMEVSEGIRFHVDSLLTARAQTAEDALALVLWSGGLLRQVLATLPSPECEQDEGVRHILSICAAMCMRATEALEIETGIAAEALYGEARFNQ